MLVHHASLARQRAQLVATGVHVERSGRPVLTELSLAVTRGMRLGIVGENGRGKSTRLQVLAGAGPGSWRGAAVGSLVRSGEALARPAAEHALERGLVTRGRLRAALAGPGDPGRVLLDLTVAPS
jgi:ATPase subunit of ABC transporter with duplicated ATPase domains